MLLTAPSILVAPGRRLSCAVSVSPELVLYSFRPRVGLVRRAGQLFTDLARDAVQHLVKFVVHPCSHFDASGEHPTAVFLPRSGVLILLRIPRDADALQATLSAPDRGPGLGHEVHQSA
jgi:hypothetical protein